MPTLGEVFAAPRPPWPLCGILTAPSDDAGAAPRPSLRVLIVEDEALFSLHLEDMVADLGHLPIGVAATQSTAIRMALLLKPELVLMDIRLAQGGNGIVAAREILDRLGARSLFITAHGDAATREAAKSAGGIDLLLKPVDRASLAAALRRAVSLLRG